MNLHRMTVHEVSDLLKNKEITSRELTEKLYDNIEVEVGVNPYITMDRVYALKLADLADKKIVSGEDMSRLAGIPFIIKDNICTKELPTTCSSKILGDYMSTFNATAVQKILDNNGVIAGKANMDEFSLSCFTNNSVHKKTMNPWDMDGEYTSSIEGTAAALATGQAYYGLGADTAGAIRQSAASCGVVGLKPTYGLVSRYGLIEFSSSQEQIGPVTKDVMDCAMVLNAIAGYDSYDSFSVDMEYPDYTKALGEDIKGLKIGIPMEYFEEGVNPEVKESVLKAVELLKELGADYEEFSFGYKEHCFYAYNIIASAEASSNLGRYDGIRYGYRNEDYEDLNEMYLKNKTEGFGQELKRRIITGAYFLTAERFHDYYLNALRVRTLVINQFKQLFGKYDVILYPTLPDTALMIDEKSNNPLETYKYDINTIPANLAGLPGISIPCGLDGRGLPIGMQFIGKPFDEAILLKTAYAYEKNSGLALLNQIGL